MGKHLAALDASTEVAEQTPAPWGLNHAKEMSKLIIRSEFEIAMADMITGLARYADAHEKQYESGIGSDYVLGPAWESIARGLITLLDGDAGRLDCGTLDGVLRGMLKREGFEGE